MKEQSSEEDLECNEHKQTDNHENDNDENSMTQLETDNLAELIIIKTLGKGVQGEAYMVLYEGKLACIKFYSSQEDMD